MNTADNIKRKNTGKCKPNSIIDYNPLVLIIEYVLSLVENITTKEGYAKVWLEVLKLNRLVEDHTDFLVGLWSPVEKIDVEDPKNPIRVRTNKDHIQYVNSLMEFVNGLLAEKHKKFCTVESAILTSAALDKDFQTSTLIPVKSTLPTPEEEVTRISNGLFEQRITNLEKVVNEVKHVVNANASVLIQTTKTITEIISNVSNLSKDHIETLFSEVKTLKKNLKKLAKKKKRATNFKLKEK